MKIQRLKTKLIGSVLLLIPMACMHLGEDHHPGQGHFSIYQASYQYSIRELPTGSTIQSAMTRLNTMMAQEGTQKPPEGEEEK